MCFVVCVVVDYGDGEMYFFVYCLCVGGDGI